MRTKTFLSLSILISSLVLLFPDSSWSGEKKLNVVTTVSPITNIVYNVAGEKIQLHGIVPEGTNSHTFEPAPSDVKYLAAADLLIMNGLHLEIPTEKLMNASKKEGAQILKLADQTISRKEWVFDFSFPKEDGHPNPHLWLSVAHSMKYAQVTRDKLIEMDPAHQKVYEENTKAFLLKLEKLDRAIMEAMKTIPKENRKLLTYHDSFAYFCPRYGCTVIGAIQPSSFSQPSPKEVANLIDQIREEKIPAIFGSEVFPSKVLDQIGKEGGVKFVDTLSDDDLPGEKDDPNHSYIGMMLQNIGTMVKTLGGDPAALKGIDATNLN